MDIPFDAVKLAALMDQAGLDIAVACSRHNVRYLAGGYFYHFHENSTRMGQSQYLPFMGMVRRSMEESFYIHRPDEGGQMGTEDLWLPNLVGAIRGTLTSAASLAGHIRTLGLAGGRIGVEMPFLPADAFQFLRAELPEAEFVDATAVFEELRAIKSVRELDTMRSAYARLADAIHATFMASRAGDTTKEIEQRVRVEMTERGLGFLFALVCAGPGFLRAPSWERWEEGRILHIDAGGGDGDYVADICRMGCLGEPGHLARELHAACIEVQDRVRSAIKPGITCREVLAIGQDASMRIAFSRYARFVVHGIGMVPYEQPVFDPPSDRPLEEGMVISIETDFLHPEVGHVKIEDAVAVTSDGCEGFGDRGRDWTIPGMA
jgi:Xaa-Pro dipeptidase